MLMEAHSLTCLWNYRSDHRRPLSAGELWPHVSGAAAGLVGDQLNPQLTINKPKWISNIPLRSLSLEDEPLDIVSIQVSLLS